MRTTLTSWTDRLTITNDTAAILAKILQKRALLGRWRPNRKWKYGGDPIFQLSDPDFLSDFLHPPTTTARRRAVKSCRTVTFTLLVNQLDTSEPEVVPADDLDLLERSPDHRERYGGNIGQNTAKKRATRGRWRPNRKWKYGGDPTFRLGDPDFLCDFLYIMGSISNRYGVCIREC